MQYINAVSFIFPFRFPQRREEDEQSDEQQSPTAKNQDTVKESKPRPKWRPRFRKPLSPETDPVMKEAIENEAENGKSSRESAMAMTISKDAAAVEYVRSGTRQFFIRRPSSPDTVQSETDNDDDDDNMMRNRKWKIIRGGRTYRSGDELDVQEQIIARPWHGKLVEGVKRWVFPAGYPDSVGPGFTEYTRWRLSSFFFGGAIGVFSTQALLLAVGVGRQSSAPLAAALQWVIRDGLGRAGRMIFSQVGNGFDAETKQYRLMAAIVLNMSCGLESLTPMIPNLFLPLACIANMAKGASTIAMQSTRPAIYRSFMRNENLGDITAKQETISVIGDLMGTCTGILLSRFISSSLYTSCFLMISAAHFVSVYHEIKQIQLSTLNRQRAHMLIKYYLDHNHVPSLSHINYHERILNRPWLDSLHAPNIDLGARLLQCAPDAQALQYLLKLYKNERYLFTYEDTRLKIVLRNDATSHDCLKAFLQADHFWNLYKQRGHRHSRNRHLLVQSYKFANSHFDDFIHQADENGWNTYTVLLRPIGRRASWNNSR